MARVIGPDSGCRTVQFGEGGPEVRRHRDGTFHVPDKMARGVAEAIGGGIAGTSFFSHDPQPTGPWCPHGLRPFFCEVCK